MKNLSIHLIVLIVLMSGSFGQEHPKEHPQSQERSENRSGEHPSKVSNVPVTKDNLATAIRNFIATETVKGKGSFVCADDETGNTLNLKLKKVHDDKLAALGNNTYFACADFVASDGKMYDIDIFMEGESEENLAPVEINVHKEEGVERYTWMELDGIWHKADVKKE